MSGKVDSSEVFLARLKFLRIGELKDKMAENGWTSFGSFTFATNIGTHGIVEGEFDTKIRDVLFPGDPKDARIPAVRRLHYEAFSTTMGDMQTRAAAPLEPEKIRPLEAPERLKRLELLRGKLSHLDIIGEFEPADALVDTFVHMQDVTNRLLFVPWESLTRHDQEIKGLKKFEKTWVF